MALTVAAPSGAAKIPSSDASSFPACSISSSVTVRAVPLVCLSIRRMRKSPSGPGTRRPEARVAAFWKNSEVARWASQALTIGAQPSACTATMRGRSELIQPISCISSNALHMPMTDATARGVQNHIRQLAAKLFPKLVAHGLLAFDAVGLLEGGNVVPSFAVLVLGNVYAAVGD